MGVIFDENGKAEKFLKKSKKRLDFLQNVVYNNTRPMERYSNGKEPHWKCGVPTRHCAFESHPLRQ